MADDGGVLGNLPSSRPGRRSAKRDSGGSPAKTAGQAAAKAEQAGKAAAKPARTSKAARTSPKPGRKAAGAASPGGRKAARAASPGGRPSAGRKPTASSRGATPRQPADPIRPEPAGDAVTAAARTAAGLAVAGVRVAGAVGRELLRRLPRP